MNIEEFKSEVGRLGIAVTDREINLLERYYELLIEYNEKINLTAITDKQEVFLKHFYDSLTLVRVIDFNEIESMCDIGTGAGFPGIVIKIFYPNVKLTLVDALNKRINFLNVVSESLGLEGITLVHARAEEYSMPIVKKNKYFVAMKGHDDTEVSPNCLNVLSSKVLKVDSFELPKGAGFRNLVLVQRIGDISLKYPRRYADMKKKPL